MSSRKPVASTSRVSIGTDGCREPDSYALTTLCVRPARWASSACDKPARWRASRISWPATSVSIDMSA
jgi:hypothetical protein